MTVLPFSPDAELNAVLIAEIPVQRIREVIGDDTELISLVFDQDRTVADSKREIINWEANDRRKAYHYSFLSLPPGSYDCRLVIRNLQTGASALASGRASVPERKEKGLQLFPPLLVTPERGALYLKQVAPKKRNVDAAALSLYDVFAIDSSEFAPRLEKELSAGSEVWAAVRCALSGGSVGGVRLAAYLIDETTGEKVALPLTIMRETEKGSESTFLIRFRVPELDRDEYSLVFVAEDTASGEMSIVGCDFVIQ
jgi:hypothetical protein